MNQSYWTAGESSAIAATVMASLLLPIKIFRMVVYRVCEYSRRAG
ncbi:hypothetical protein ACNKHR_11315 [Shigella flexneri]